MRKREMRIASVVGGCLAAGLLLLQAHVAQAQTADIYVINVDENGNGTYAEYSPPTVTPADLIASGTLPWAAIEGGGITYSLPYTININANSNQWLALFDPGVPPPLSDMVQWQNVSGVGQMTIYSGDYDGDIADVGPTFVQNLYNSYFDGWSATENASGVAFYSTYIDTGGVPGDPYPHPAVEAYYYINSGPVPEPMSMSLALVCGGLVLTRRPRRA